MKTRNMNDVELHCREGNFGWMDRGIIYPARSQALAHCLFDGSIYCIDQFYNFGIKSYSRKWLSWLCYLMKLSLLMPCWGHMYLLALKQLRPKSDLASFSMGTQSQPFTFLSSIVVNNDSTLIVNNSSQFFSVAVLDSVTF